MTEEDLASMLTKLGCHNSPPTTPTNNNSNNPTSPKLQLHLIGGFADTKNVSESLLTPVLALLHRTPHHLHLTTCCIGHMATTVARNNSGSANGNGAPWPAVYGVGVSVKSGALFPAAFLDRGPDLDMRLARTLTGGETVGILDIY